MVSAPSQQRSVRAAGGAAPRLLISTPNPPLEGLYVLDTASGASRRIHSRRVRGVTRGPDGYYFSEHDGAIFHLHPLTLEITLRAETGQNGCHDLRWIDGAFYLVASYGNRVTRFDERMKRIDDLQLVPDEGDVCHPNCLIERDGELLLSIFTLTQGRREVKNQSDAWRTAGKILRLDWSAGRFDVLFEPLSQPHSLVALPDGRVLCCESHESALVEVDLVTQSKRRVRRLHGFVRGMMLHGDSLWVGISSPKRRRPTGWRERLLARMRLPCGMLELDPRTYQTRARHAMPGLEVYDCVVLDD